MHDNPYCCGFMKTQKCITAILASKTSWQTGDIETTIRTDVRH